MNALTEYFLESVRWDSVRAIGSKPAKKVPDSVRRLADAESEGEALAAYWELDNYVVVQGQLYEAALPLIPVLLAAVAGDLALASRICFMDLIVEIACGSPHDSEQRLGNGELGRDCRRAARAGLWLFYSMSFQSEPALRERALQIVYAVDEDRNAVSAMLSHLATTNPEPRVRARVTELQGYMPNMIYEQT